MDIRLVRRALLDVAGDESPDKPHPAIQALAVALLHVAEALEEMRAALARLEAAASARPAKPAARGKNRGVKRKKR